MTLTVSCKRYVEDDEAGSANAEGVNVYKRIFEVDQTDGGAAACGAQITLAAQAANDGPDLVPMGGDAFTENGYTDVDSYLINFEWKRPMPRDDKKRWHITCNYGPAAGFNPGHLTAGNPLDWPTEYWLEWSQEQVPIKVAKNQDNLPGIGRDVGTLGPIVNAVGEDTIEPQMKVVYYPILCAQKAYANLNDIIAKNTTYQDTTNNGTYFGAAQRNAKYLLTESGHVQKLRGQSYFLGVTRIWFKNLTWDLKVLNIGFNMFVKKAGAYLEGDYAGPFGGPQQHRCTVRDVTIDPDTGDPIQGGWVPSSEPLRLALDGTHLPHDSPAVNLTYRELTEVNYGGIGIGG